MYCHCPSVKEKVENGLLGQVIFIIIILSVVIVWKDIHLQHLIKTISLCSNMTFLAIRVSCSNYSYISIKMKQYSSIEHGGMSTVFYMVEQFDSMGVRDHFPICRNFCVGIFFGIFLFDFLCYYTLVFLFGTSCGGGILYGSPCI